MIDRPIEFVHAQNDPKRVGGVKAIRVHPTYNIPIKVNAVNCIDSNSPVQVMRTQSTSKDIQGTERVYPADLVLIGLDGGRVDVQLWEDDIEIPLKTNGMIKAEVNDYCTGIQGLFACGDCRT